MKLLTMFLILIFSSTALSSYFPVGKEGAKKSYNTKQLCEQLEGQDCFQTFGKDLRYHEVKTVEKDDTTKPIFATPYSVQVCDSDQDCRAKMEATTCTEGDILEIVENTILPGKKVQCKNLIGYEKKTSKELVENELLKTQVLSEDTAKKALAVKVAQKQKDMNFGRDVKALFSVKADAKNLSLAQRTEMANEFEVVQRLLDSGSIQAARDTINGLVPDGSKVTAQDKTDLLQMLDDYLNN